MACSSAVLPERAEILLHLGIRRLEIYLRHFTHRHTHTLSDNFIHIYILIIPNVNCPHPLPLPQTTPITRASFIPSCSVFIITESIHFISTESIRASGVRVCNLPVGIPPPPHLQPPLPTDSQPAVRICEPELLIGWISCRS